MNHLAKIQEVILWTLCGIFIPVYQVIWGNNWGLFFMMPFWLFYGLRLGALLCLSLHSQVVKTEYERSRVAEYAEPPPIHKDLTVHVYPLIEWLVYHSPRTFDGLQFNVMGKNYKITHVYLNAATVYASLEESEPMPVALTDNRKGLKVR